MRIKLARCKQTDSRRETEHKKKKMKMASARKPESFVWTSHEIELLLRLTFNYKTCKLQERLNIFMHKREHVVRHCCCC